MRRVFAEFEPQEALTFIYPFKGSDWTPYLKEITDSYNALSLIVSDYQKVLMITPNIDHLPTTHQKSENIMPIEAIYNDTWARDILPISSEHNGYVELLKFQFNGWGDKYDYNLDNSLGRRLFEKGVYQRFNIHHLYESNLCLEGGAIDSNGAGLILTNSQSFYRRNPIPFKTVQRQLEELFDARLVVIHNGYLEGDDTNAHIDNLVRFVNTDSIVYLTCDDRMDRHFEPLKAMEKEVEAIAKARQLNAIPITMPTPKYYNKQRLPASYINFIILNRAVIVPTYNDKNDDQALIKLQNCFMDRAIIPFNAEIFIRQNGSLHCASMNIPHLND